MYPKDIRGLSWGQCGTSLEGQGSHDSGLGRGHKGPVNANGHRDRKGSTRTCSYS
jgi:hypothetical protein